MRILVILSILFNCFQAGAQKIYFSDSSNKWKYSTPGNAQAPYVGGFFQQTYAGTKSIKRSSYLILPSLGQSLSPGYIREDTVQKKVFIRFDSLAGLYNIKPDTFEHVLYDYNLQVGDTFRFSPDYGVSEFVHIVTSIDSVLIRGASYKVWHLGGFSGPGVNPFSYMSLKVSAVQRMACSLPFPFISSVTPFSSASRTTGLCHQ